MKDVKRKVGRPKDSLEYDPDYFLRILGNTPLSTDKVRQKFTETYGVPTSWNTVDKYLKILAKKGLIKHRRFCNYNVWSI